MKQRDSNVGYPMDAYSVAAVSSVVAVGSSCVYDGAYDRPAGRPSHLVRCDYCGRTQERDPKGGCHGCAAPLPREQYRNVTAYL